MDGIFFRLEERMKKLGIREEDITEKFVRSQGPGGQNVNKVSTTVYLRHAPTGVEVKCGTERSQAQNRAEARRILVEKIMRLREAGRMQEQQKLEKAKRQNRRKSRASREKMLEDKKRRSRKKRLRGRVSSAD